jgi:hypothetical protein
MNCQGDHKLIEIFRAENPNGIEHVVRWCGDCGAIVVDGEMDGRVKPGAAMRLRLPVIARREIP